MPVPSFEQLLSQRPAVPNSMPPRGGPDKPPSPRDSSKEVRPADKKSRNRVMIVGRIRELALYRAEVLRHEGFQVSTPETREEAISIIRNGGFDVAVLSYTLLSSLVTEIAEEIREYCPDCRIVAIADSTRFDRRIAPDAIALAEEGPPALIAAIHKSLQSG